MNEAGLGAHDSSLLRVGKVYCWRNSFLSNSIYYSSDIIRRPRPKASIYEVGLQNGDSPRVIENIAFLTMEKLSWKNFLASLKHLLQVTAAAPG